jgi:hypothetical protein
MIIAMTCVATLFLLAFGALLASNASAIPSVRSQRLDAVSSPQAVARSVEEIASKLLMIAEPEVSLRKRGLITVREGFPGRGGSLLLQ